MDEAHRYVERRCRIGEEMTDIDEDEPETPPTKAWGGRAVTETDRLWEAIDMLWGWMTPDLVRDIRADNPELVELCHEAHHRVWHATTQRMIRRLSQRPNRRSFD